MKFDYIKKKILSSEIQKYPFKYLCVDNFLSKADYHEIVNNLPKDSKWETKESKNRRRSWQAQTYTFNHKLINLTSDLSNFLESETFINMLLKIFNIKKNISNGIAKTAWCRDYDAFSISPHKDLDSKILSFLIYLPKNNNNKQNGTQLLKPIKNIKNKGDNHLQWYDFKKIKDIDFVKNRFICWSVNSNSFHSVDVRFSRGDKDSYRDTIRGFYFRDKKNLPSLFTRYK
mgnify:CR=1 FL=1